MEEVSTRLFERETDAAGISNTFDLNRGVIVEDTTTDTMKANEERAISTHFFFHTNLTKSNALLTKSGLTDFCSMVIIYLHVIK
jgi:hypothetical protein